MDPWQEVYDILLEAKKSDDPVKSLKGKVGGIGDDYARMWLAKKIVSMENGKTTLDDAIKELKANHPEVVEKEKLPAEEEGNDGKTIAFFGHSIMAGIFGGSEMVYWTNGDEKSKIMKDIENSTGYEIMMVDGKISRSISQVKKGISDAFGKGGYLNGKHVGAVVVYAGINDYGVFVGDKYLEPERVVNQFRKICDLALQSAETVYIFEITNHVKNRPKADSSIAEVNKQLLGLEKEYSGKVKILKINSTDISFPDGVHPSYKPVRKFMINQLNGKEDALLDIRWKKTDRAKQIEPPRLFA